MLPWDYDRLNDEGGKYRGANAGRPFWTPLSPSDSECTAPILTPEERGRQAAGDKASDEKEVKKWVDVYRALPPDINIPIMCDKITRLMQAALIPKFKQAIRDMAEVINWPVRAKERMTVWTEQIESSIAIVSLFAILVWTNTLVLIEICLFVCLFVCKDCMA